MITWILAAIVLLISASLIYWHKPTRQIHGVTWLLIDHDCVYLERCAKKARVLGVGEWFVPGGKIEGRETPEQALGRDHRSFHANVEVNRLSQVEGGPVENFQADVTIRCAGCGTPFEFVGLGVGMSPLEPLTDPLRTELRAPIVPLGAIPNPNMLGYRMVRRAPAGQQAS